MTERQPDMLGGKTRSARTLPRARRRAAPRVVPAGHAAPPGTGPAGETCGSCHWLESFHFRKTYHKCGARPGDHWKGGRSTDVRPLDPACAKFERLANRAAAAPSKAQPCETLAKIVADKGFGTHRIGSFDILIAPAVKTPQRHREDDHDRQASLFD